MEENLSMLQRNTNILLKNLTSIFNLSFRWLPPLSFNFKICHKTLVNGKKFRINN